MRDRRLTRLQILTDPPYTVPRDGIERKGGLARGGFKLDVGKVREARDEGGP